MKNTLIYLAIITLSISCSQKKRTIEIVDFSNPYKETLIPIKNGGYTSASYKIKGNSNDTIIIQFYGLERKYIGKFEDKLNGDYYGSIEVDFLFNPYRATKGKIEVEYGIY